MQAGGTGARAACATPVCRQRDGAALTNPRSSLALFGAQVRPHLLVIHRTDFGDGAFIVPHPNRIESAADGADTGSETDAERMRELRAALRRHSQKIRFVHTGPHDERAASERLPS